MSFKGVRTPLGEGTIYHVPRLSSTSLLSLATSHCIFPSLWVHVDLAICKTLYQWETLLDRVQTYEMRSGELPLQIHISEKEVPSSTCERSHIRDILRPIIGRMEGLEFNMHGERDEFHNSVLTAVLSDCTAQKFIKLAIDSTHGRYNNFILSMNEIAHANEFMNYLRLPLPRNEIEDSLSHLNVLRLAGFFPEWKSVAYHGLIDLRLVSPHASFSSGISKLDLANILRASPALRILHLELSVIDPNIISFLEDDKPVDPVSLEHLEVLKLIVDDFWNREADDPPAVAGSLLQLFVPGSRPLHFTFQTADYPNNLSFEEVKSFFMRSNIVKFCSRDAYPPLDELLTHAHNLQTLVFDRCIYRDTSRDLVSQANRNSTSLNFHWGSWYMRNCRIYMDDLSTIVRLYSSGELVLLGCAVYRNSSGSIGEIEVPEEELAALFPSAKFVAAEADDYLPDPTEDWDVLN